MATRVKYAKLIRAHTLMRAAQSLVIEAHAHLIDQPDLAKICATLEKAQDAVSEAKAYMGDSLEVFRDAILEPDRPIRASNACGCGHSWSVHDKEGCKPAGWDKYSSMFCGCSAKPPT